jgi:hypothetical protein
MPDWVAVTADPDGLSTTSSGTPMLEEPLPRDVAAASSIVKLPVKCDCASRQ